MGVCDAFLGITYWDLYILYVIPIAFIAWILQKKNARHVELGPIHIVEPIRAAFSLLMKLLHKLDTIHILTPNHYAFEVL